MAIIGRNFEIEDLGGGKFRSTINLKPSAYFESGSWRRMTLDFLDSGIIERPHLVTAAPMMVTVAPDGLRRLHPTRELDRYLEIGAPFIKVAGVWQKAPLGAPVRSANLLNWMTTNANMYLAHGGHFVKVAILLKGGWVPEGGQFAFPVGISGLTRSGGQILADGVPVAQLRAPHVEDLDNPDDQRPVDWQFVSLSGQPYVLFTLPSLTGMGRPLIDPTLSLQPDATDGLDTWINSSAPTSNQGTSVALVNGDSHGTVSRAERSLIKFNVSSIPAGSTIDSVTLSLFENQALDGAGIGPWAVGLRRVLRDWVEVQATWNVYSTGNNWTTAGCESDGNDRAASDSASVSPDGTAANAFVDWSGSGLVSDVQGYVDSSFSNYGWLLQSPTAEYQANTSANLYRSSDYGTAEQRPKLVVNYTEAGGDPEGSLIGGKLLRGGLLTHGVLVRG